MTSAFSPYVPRPLATAAVAPPDDPPPYIYTPPHPTVQFLHSLFPLIDEREGEEVELRAIGRDGGPTTSEGATRTPHPATRNSLVRRAWVSDMDEAWRWAQAEMERADVYFGVAPRRNRDGTAAGVSAIHALWGDFDFKNGHTLDTRLAQLDDLLCPPTTLVNSGGGLHAYWLLSEPITEPRRMKAASSLMRDLARSLEADNVGDLPHLLRVPGTLNHKYDPPRPVEMREYRYDGIYSIHELSEMELRVRDVDRGLSYYKAMERAADLEQYQALNVAEALNGVPEGQRDTTLFRLACRLRAAGVPVEAALELVLRAARNCKPPFSRQTAAEKVMRAYRRYPSNVVEEAILKEPQRKSDAERYLERLSLKDDVQLSSLLPQPSSLIEAGGDELAASGGAKGVGGEGGPASLPVLGQRGYVIEGWSHLVAGYPRCGKTELLLRLCGEWLAEGRKVVYFTEEPRSIWEHRLGAASGQWPVVSGQKRASVPPTTDNRPLTTDHWRSLRVVFALGSPPQSIFERAFGGDEGVVVIDTMRSLLQIVDETDNSRLALSLNPWIAEARARGKTLLIAHHMRKGSGEHGEGIAGGHALLGTFDVALELRRDEHQPRRRRVRAYARLVSPPEMVYELTDAGEMRHLGDPSAVALGEVMERVLANLGEEWEKTAQVREGLGDPLPSPVQVRVALATLAARGEVERDPPLAEEHQRGATLRWRRAQNQQKVE